MGENDRELGEISAKLTMLAQAVERLSGMVESMRTDGCVVGRENRQDNTAQDTRLDALEASLKRIMVAVGVIILGGQTGIELWKQYLVP
jgi:hypothetical protein